MSAIPAPFATAHDSYRAAVLRFLGLPADLEFTDPEAFEREEDLLSAAHDDMDATVPETWADLIVKLQHMIGGGSSPGIELCDRLIADAQRLHATKQEGR